MTGDGRSPRGRSRVVVVVVVFIVVVVIFLVIVVGIATGGGRTGDASSSFRRRRINGEGRKFAGNIGLGDVYRSWHPPTHPPPPRDVERAPKVWSFYSSHLTPD